jgi:hypothetical protein
MNHDDFQRLYMYWTEGSDRLKEVPYSSFYSALRENPEVETIIEAPFVAMWWIHLLQVDQRLHGKKVLIGHDPQSFTAQVSMIMHPGVHLANFVNLFDFRAIQASGASYVVIHKDLFKEFEERRENQPAYRRRLAQFHRDLGRLEYLSGEPARNFAVRYVRRVKRYLGKPCFEDAWIQVFKIQAGKD